MATIRTETAAIVENMRLKDISSGSGQAFLDRMDICVTTNAATYGEFRGEIPDSDSIQWSTENMRKEVERARLIQKERLKESGICYNSQIRRVRSVHIAKQVKKQKKCYRELLKSYI